MERDSENMSNTAYAEEVKTILKSLNGLARTPTTIIELFPEYTLVLGRLRSSNISKYIGIEPHRPDRTKQAVAYEKSFDGYTPSAKIIRENPYEYLKAIKASLDDVVIVSYMLDDKADIEKMAKILYDKSTKNSINIHLGLKDESAFIDAGFKKKDNVFLKI